MKGMRWERQRWDRRSGQEAAELPLDLPAASAAKTPAKAGLRLPEPVPIRADNVADWMARGLRVSEIMSRSRKEPLGLPYDGQTFVEDDPGQCADRLQQLADAGYRVPPDVITDLREEQADLDRAEARR